MIELSKFIKELVKSGLKDDVKVELNIVCMTKNGKVQIYVVDYCSPPPEVTNVHKLTLTVVKS